MLRSPIESLGNKLLFKNEPITLEEVNSLSFEGEIKYAEACEILSVAIHVMSRLSTSYIDKPELKMTKEISEKIIVALSQKMMSLVGKYEKILPDQFLTLLEKMDQISHYYPKSHMLDFLLDFYIKWLTEAFDDCRQLLSVSQFMKFIEITNPIQSFITTHKKLYNNMKCVIRKHRKKFSFDNFYSISCYCSDLVFVNQFNFDKEILEKYKESIKKNISNINREQASIIIKHFKKYRIDWDYITDLQKIAPSPTTSSTQLLSFGKSTNTKKNPRNLHHPMQKIQIARNSQKEKAAISSHFSPTSEYLSPKKFLIKLKSISKNIQPQDIEWISKNFESVLNEMSEPDFMVCINIMKSICFDLDPYIKAIEYFILARKKDFSFLDIDLIANYYPILIFSNKSTTSIYKNFIENHMDHLTYIEVKKIADNFRKNKKHWEYLETMLIVTKNEFIPDSKKISIYTLPSNNIQNYSQYSSNPIENTFEETFGNNENYYEQAKNIEPAYELKKTSHHALVQNNSLNYTRPPSLNQNNYTDSSFYCSLQLVFKIDLAKNLSRWLLSTLDQSEKQKFFDIVSEKRTLHMTLLNVSTIFKRIEARNLDFETFINTIRDTFENHELEQNLVPAKLSIYKKKKRNFLVIEFNPNVELNNLRSELREDLASFTKTKRRNKNIKLHITLAKSEDIIEDSLFQKLNISFIKHSPQFIIHYDKAVLHSSYSDEEGNFYEQPLFTIPWDNNARKFLSSKMLDVRIPHKEKYRVTSYSTQISQQHFSPISPLSPSLTSPTILGPYQQATAQTFTLPFTAMSELPPHEYYSLSPNLPSSFNSCPHNRPNMRSMRGGGSQQRLFDHRKIPQREKTSHQSYNPYNKTPG